jgi:DNA recombination-dependent growth factor C
MPLTELKSKYRKVSSIDKVSKGWQDEYDVSSKQVMWKQKKNFFVITVKHDEIYLENSWVNEDWT